MLTVTIPVHNAERYVAQAIESILKQTFSDFRLIVVDDGSTDASLSIVREFERADSRVSVIAQEQSGISAARNRALGLATTKYIANLDADDIAEPERLAAQIAYMESHPDCVLVGSQATLIDADGDVLGETAQPPVSTASRSRARRRYKLKTLAE